jgi:uncharacterized protein (TIGR03435 family)
LPVVDLTDFKGLYPAAGGVGEVPTTSDPDGLTVFDALQSQLGLKLESRKHPMDIIVVDKVERVPTDN